MALEAQPRFARHGTLAADAVTTLAFDVDCNVIHIKAYGTVPIYGTIDGGEPAVGGDDTFRVDPGSVLVHSSANPGVETVRLISTGTPEYAVEGYRA